MERRKLEMIITNIKRALVSLALTSSALFISFLMGGISIYTLYSSVQLGFVTLIAVSAFIIFYLLVKKIGE